MELAIVKSQTQENGTTLLLEPNGNPIAKTYQQALYQNNLPVIVFGTNNIEYEYDRLIKLGVAFKNPPQKSEWGISTIFDDTFGNWIQLHQEIGL
ncbi:MAG: VOC family protein, partial [Bacteroidota bacterium]